MGKANRAYKRGFFDTNTKLSPKDIFNYRVKIFIPDYYAEIFGDALVETLGEAMKGLEIDAKKFERDDRQQGTYLYLFKANAFPFVKHGDKTPDAALWLSASEGWKLQWQRREEGLIVVPEEKRIIH